MPSQNDATQPQSGVDALRNQWLEEPAPRRDTQDELRNRWQANDAPHRQDLLAQQWSTESPATSPVQRQPDPAHHSGTQAVQARRSGGRLPIILGVLLLIALIAAGGYFLLSRLSTPATGATEPVTSVVVTTVVGANPSEPDAPATTVAGSSTEGVSPAEASASPLPEEPPTDRPERPALPAGAVAVNEAARLQQPAGSFNNVHKSGSTSDPFALAVRDAYVNAYLGNGALNQSVTAYSTTTGKTYVMDCRDNGSYVTCTGGNAAVVYIS